MISNLHLACLILLALLSVKQISHPKWAVIKQIISKVILIYILHIPVVSPLVYLSCLSCLLYLTGKMFD